MGKIRCAVKWGLNILNACLTSAVVRSSRGVSGRAWPLRITNPCRPRYFGARWFSRRLTEYATRRTHMHDRSQGSLESPKAPTQPAILCEDREGDRSRIQNTAQTDYGNDSSRIFNFYLLAQESYSRFSGLLDALLAFQHASSLSVSDG
jgi:hypothetical protein